MDELLTPEEVAEWFKTSTKMLANDRYLGRGPRFIKVGKYVRYRVADCKAYLDANQYTRTDTRVPA
ncbi:DNA-binding protein [Microbacterium sp. NPDC078814]|uniref:helix-turn-helix transcriptional regulator n=1 Tax=Microbacterium sp. NPDC078814 TaxID=3154767 RepID=UPI00344F29AF